MDLWRSLEAKVAGSFDNNNQGEDNYLMKTIYNNDNNSS